MKKQDSDTKRLIIILSLLTAAIVALAVILIVRLNQHSSVPPSQGGLYLYDAADADLIIPKLNDEEFYPIAIITNRSEFTKVMEEYNNSEFGSRYQDEFSGKFNGDFATSNYLVLGYVNEYCGIESFVYRGIDNNSNHSTVYLTYKTGCGPCSIYGSLMFVEVPKNITNLDQISYNIDSSHSDCDPMVELKPIIYLYPESETEVEVSLGSPERLTTTYPKYQDGWHVFVRPDGTLTDLKTGRELYSLYWEGIRNYTPNLSEGFIVKGEDSAKFLEEKLDYLGLNAKEAEEFIVYWLPELEGSPYNLIKFEDTETIENDMSIIITEKGETITPDTLIRVRMAYQALEKPVDITEQKLTPAPVRHGFTVVEWGGTKL